MAMVIKKQGAGQVILPGGGLVGNPSPIAGGVAGGVKGPTKPLVKNPLLKPAKVVSPSADVVAPKASSQSSGGKATSQELVTPKAVVAKQGVGMVSKSYSDGTELHEQENVGEPSKISGHPAMVEVSVGVTRNLGKYESVKFHVGLTLPCTATAEDIDATYHEAKGWVDQRVESINAEITKELGN